MPNTSNFQSKANRLAWIDILKGLGILSVVVGHAMDGQAQDFIFLFHMPLFFYIGGFLYKKRPDKEYFKAKLVHLVVPYCSFLALLYSKELFELLTNLDQTTFISAIKTLLRPLIGGKALKEWTGVFWFVSCFFIVQQVFNFMANRLRNWQIGIVCFVMLSLSYLNSQFFSKLWLPLNANVALAALPFFFLGYLFKNLHEKKNVYILGIGISVCYLLLFQESITAYNMKYTYYGLPFISFVGATGIIISSIWLCQKLSNYSLFSKGFSQIGSASMVIMYLHQPILFSLRYYGFGSLPFMILFAVVFSFIAYLLLCRSYLTRAIFLGNYADYLRLKADIRRSSTN